MRRLHSGPYFLCIAFQVSDRHIDLSQCDTKRYNIHTTPFHQCDTMESTDFLERQHFSTMEIRAFAALVIPYIIVFYLAVLLFMHPPKAVLFASLLGGLLAGLINALVDLAAYYAHWWHYTLNELILHVPLPFYITP